jgi:hypothetical protein
MTAVSRDGGRDDYKLRLDKPYGWLDRRNNAKIIGHDKGVVYRKRVDRMSRSGIREKR